MNISGEGDSATTFADLPPLKQSRVPTIYEVENIAAGALTECLSTALKRHCNVRFKSIG